MIKPSHQERTLKLLVQLRGTRAIFIRSVDEGNDIVRVDETGPTPQEIGKKTHANEGQTRDNACESSSSGEFDTPLRAESM